MGRAFAEAKVLWRGTEAEMRRIEKSTQRATMYTVREAGRTARKEAKRAAPVYKGGATRLTEKQQGPQVGPSKPIRGLLRASIKASRRLIKDGEGGFTVKVGVRGPRVHLYSQKIEAKYGYMHQGYEAANAAMPRIATQAWAKATKTRGGRAR